MCVTTKFLDVTDSMQMMSDVFFLYFESKIILEKRFWKKNVKDVFDIFFGSYINCSNSSTVILEVFEIFQEDNSDFLCFDYFRSIMLHNNDKSKYLHKQTFSPYFVCSIPSVFPRFNEFSDKSGVIL